MSASLYLQEARTVLDEPGVGLQYDFGSSQAEEVRRLVKEGVIGPASIAAQPYYEPIGGVWMAAPSFDIPDMLAAEWTLTTLANWTQAEPRIETTGDYTIGWTHTADAAWSATKGGDYTPAEGTPFWFRFYPYPGDGGEAGPITLEFGLDWRLELESSGSGILSMRDDSTLPDGTVVLDNFEPVARFEWMAAEEWAGHWHWLWVYEIAGRIVVCNAARNREGKALGTSYLAPIYEVPTMDAVTGLPVPYHALGESAWTASGSGRVTVMWGWQQYVPATYGLKRLKKAAIGPEGSTQAATTQLYGVGTDLVGAGQVTAAVTLTDQDDATWPQDGSTFSPAKTSLDWLVEWTATTTDSYLLTGLAVVIPRTTRSTGEVGTDILGLTAVADKRIELTREGDLTRETLTANLFTSQGNLASYVLPNMAVRYVVNGTTVFRGLTNRAEWVTLADTSPATGYLTISAEGLWKRFRKALWPGGQPFDGRLLTDCLAEVLQASGLTASDYSVGAWAYTFPETPEGEPPALAYRPGTPIDRILEDFSSKFYGLKHQHYFRLSDGKFIFGEVDPDDAAVTNYFYQTSAAAAAAGRAYQVLLAGSYQEQLDESEMANMVVVVGEGPDEQPLIARATDWSSIRDPAASNFVGEFWPLVVFDPGLQTQGAVNYVCRRLFDRARWPRVYAEWESVRVNVFPGQLVQLVGSNYGGTYRLKGIRLAAGSDGDEADPLGRASYQAELVA